MLLFSYETVSIHSIYILGYVDLDSTSIIFGTECPLEKMPCVSVHHMQKMRFCHIILLNTHPCDLHCCPFE